MSNLVTNGEFASDTTGWSATNATMASSAGGVNGNALTLTNSASSVGYTIQDVTTVSGTLYTFIVYVKAGTAPALVEVGTTGTSNAYYSSGSQTGTDWKYLSVTFTATATTTRISLKCNDSTNGHNAYFDGVWLEETAVLLAAASNSHMGLSLYRRALPWWLGNDPTALFYTDMSGTLSGTVSFSGTMANVRVSIFDKRSRFQVAQVHPANDGTFSFSGLDKSNPNQYFIVCEVPGSYNAIVYDKLSVS